MKTIILSIKETNDILRLAIKYSNHTINEIATKSGINLNTIYNWHYDKTYLKATNFDKLLAYFKEYDVKALTIACYMLGYNIQL